MSPIGFARFSEINPTDLLAVLNEPMLRRHLIEHPRFDLQSLNEWIKDKNRVDALPGCRVRVVLIGEAVVGWCGIQPDKNGFEVAIVIARPFWGAGIAIFNIMMGWARELGHKTVLFHLLDTRPEYKALSRIAAEVHKTELLERTFTTYRIEVDSWQGATGLLLQ